MPGVTVVPDLDAAIRAAGSAPELVVAGGAQIYTLALPRATRIYLTRIHAVIDGDTRLPDINLGDWDETARELHPADARHPYAMSFVTLERVLRRSKAKRNLSAMQVLFVHGMGRSPLSGWPLLARLRRAGLHTHNFGHLVSHESSRPSSARLRERLTRIADHGDYVVVGHSLGGVLLREALRTLPRTARPPRHLFLLGSPVQMSERRRTAGARIPCTAC